MNEIARDDVIVRLGKVENELNELRLESSQLKLGRREETIAKLNELSSADVAKMSIEEIVENNDKIAALEALLVAITERTKAINNRIVALTAERRRLQEARVHGQNVERFKADVVSALQARRNDILAQLAKVDGELEKMGVAA